MKTVWRLARASASAYARDKASTFAAAIAYHTLFSLFPLALFVIGVGGYFMTKGQRDALVRELARALGSSSGANIERQIRLVTNGRAGISLVGLALALWSASAIFGSLRTGLNVVWKYERRRSLLTGKLQDLIAVLGFGGLLGIAFAGTFVLTLLSEIAHRLLGARLGEVTTLVFGALFFLLPFALSFGTFGVLYIVTSPPGVRWHRVWPGALIGAIGFQALNLGFSVFVRSYGSFDKVYGSLGAVIAFLFYAYLLGSLLLFGGEVAHEHARLQARPADPALPADDALRLAPPG
ncbi:MAG TPA: YihY/virulence factor BrkB family protein [Dehalococcoidia bacterium]|nr:YihY/virulence factor BrkB family protein [Dehalococcoidia bacterium]